jgi:hypothetical protein
MDRELEQYVNDASDPRLIAGIYNYCHRRCEQCPFTERCLTFRQLRDDEVHRPGLTTIERANEDFARTYDLLKDWCEQEGIDFDALREEAEAEAAAAEQSPRNGKAARDPLTELALSYTQAASGLVSALDRLAPYQEWSPVVRQALDTIGWYAPMIAAKVHRALQGVGREPALRAAGDSIQSDWNGSAKAGRLAIAESQRAWDTLLLVGQAPPDAEVRRPRELLVRIDEGLAHRFPSAMEFVRPGFDEPEIAAGALSTLACYEPRRPRRGVADWLHRVAGAWQRRS